MFSCSSRNSKSYRDLFSFSISSSNSVLGFLNFNRCTRLRSGSEARRLLACTDRELPALSLRFASRAQRGRALHSSLPFPPQDAEPPEETLEILPKTGAPREPYPPKHRHRCRVWQGL